MKKTLVIFAKEPKAGKVKTRLKNTFSKSECVNLYKSFLKDTIDLANRIDCNERIIAFEAGNETPKFLKSIAPNFKFYKQSGRNLGERMKNAFVFSQQTDTNKTVIIGSDSPVIPINYLKSAFQYLKDNDVVLGPSIDGGYYLIGMKKYIPGVFKNIRWSSNTTLAATTKNCLALRKKITYLNTWFDIDDAGSLSCLKGYLKQEKNKNTGRHTRKFLKDKKL